METYGSIIARIYREKRRRAEELGLDYEGFDALNRKLIHHFMHYPNIAGQEELKKEFEKYLSDNGLTKERAKTIFSVTP